MTVADLIAERESLIRARTSAWLDQATTSRSPVGRRSAADPPGGGAYRAPTGERAAAVAIAKDGKPSTTG